MLLSQYDLVSSSVSTAKHQPEASLTRRTVAVDTRQKFDAATSLCLSNLQSCSQGYFVPVYQKPIFSLPPSFNPLTPPIVLSNKLVGQSLLSRAAAHTQLGQYDLAIKDCEQSIRLDPHYARAYSRLGLAYFEKGEYQTAIDRGFSKGGQSEPPKLSFACARPRLLRCSSESNCSLIRCFQGI
jgi:tetratricopeptide (TPR) repeat protein